MSTMWIRPKSRLLVRPMKNNHEAGESIAPPQVKPPVVRFAMVKPIDEDLRQRLEGRINVLEVVVKRDRCHTKEREDAQEVSSAENAERSDEKKSQIEEKSVTDNSIGLTWYTPC